MQSSVPDPIVAFLGLFFWPVSPLIFAMSLLPGTDWNEATAPLRGAVQSYVVLQFEEDHLVRWEVTQPPYAYSGANASWRVEQMRRDQQHRQWMQQWEQQQRQRARDIRHGHK